MTNIRVVCLVLTIGTSSCVASAGTLYLDPMFGVQKTSNLVYGQGLIDNGNALLDLKLDIYQPTDIGVAVPESRPTIMWIHGGGWEGGTKRSVNQEEEWVPRGYNVVSIEYRLLGDNVPLTTGPADDFPFLGFLGPPGITSTVNASLEDGALALEWLHANANTYGIDTKRIGVAGISAGAVNALVLGHLVEPENVEIKAVISVSGALFNFTNPFTPGGPPTMLITGENDKTLPPEFGVLTRDLMNEAGIANEFYLEPDTGHLPNWDVVIDGQTLSEHGVDFLYQNVALVPEPSTFALGALAMMIIFGAVARRRTVRRFGS
ncbi:MAG: alpha/beta hydrolase [Pirellulales bacterium]